MAQGFGVRDLTNPDQSNEFKQERLAALLSLDKQAILAYARKWGAPVIDNDEELFWASVHRARVNLREMPLEARATSKQWLVNHGFLPGDRG